MIDAALRLDPTRVYAFSGSRYVVFDPSDPHAHSEPRPIVEGLPALAGTVFAHGVDAAASKSPTPGAPNEAYLGRGEVFVRYNLDDDTLTAGPSAIGSAWSALTRSGFDRDVDAAMRLDTDHVRLFKGSRCLTLNLRDKSVEVGPQPIAECFPGLAGTDFAADLGAVAERDPDDSGDSRIYFFKNGSYLKYDASLDAVAGGPVRVSDAWPRLREAGFGA
ncbi:hypothetical protein [Streptomyces tsukubensis]|uniref:Hemopexin n=1 Tax=Streptomyces tsukubensis TaxID=83656 RepID=A0A1V3ZYI0_9ACTN|nr:hypothetical protein [Streptomyces tsukubensis]OON71342.1 hypothetical protein B1H18_34250 [Streptomyces tsukubensis]QFR96688.1 hypothetical protein GBW32_31215 [Streptomyces tsukubensis]